MLTSFIILSISGFLAGFVLSMPIVGPIGILITSNALRGRLRFCIRTAIGAALVEFVYVFIVVYGVSSLFSFYRPYIPYLFIVGTIVLCVTGVKIIQTRLDLSHIDDRGIVSDKLKNKGGFRTGILINLTNPTILFSWLITSFLILSSLSSLGLSTSGFETRLNKTVNELQKMEELNPDQMLQDTMAQNPSVSSDHISSPLQISLSITFALAVSLGSLLYLISFARFLVKHRAKLNIALLQGIIRSLGVALLILSGILGYKAIKFFL